MTILIKSRSIVAALVTPFSLDGEVNCESLVMLVEHVIRAGAGGLYVCGTTGEGFLLSETERRQVVETVVATSAGRADVIVNISHMDFRQALELAAHAAAVGADAVSTLPPVFYGASDEEQLAYFRAIIQGVRLPITIYNIPHLSHRTLAANVVAALAEESRFVGIKHTSDDTAALKEYKLVTGGRLIVWCGRDAKLLEHLSAGADGAIGSSYQVLADMFAEILRAFRAGDQERAAELQQRVNEVHLRLQGYGAIQSIKRCLTLQGIEAGGCRLPLTPVRMDVDDYHCRTLELADEVRQDFRLPPLKATAGR